MSICSAMVLSYSGIVLHHQTHGEMWITNESLWFFQRFLLGVCLKTWIRCVQSTTCIFGVRWFRPRFSSVVQSLQDLPYPGSANSSGAFSIRICRFAPAAVKVAPARVHARTIWNVCKSTFKTYCNFDIYFELCIWSIAHWRLSLARSFVHTWRTQKIERSSIKDIADKHFGW